MTPKQKAADPTRTKRRGRALLIAPYTGASKTEGTTNRATTRCQADSRWAGPASAAVRTTNRRRQWSAMTRPSCESQREANLQRALGTTLFLRGDPAALPGSVGVPIKPPGPQPRQEILAAQKAEPRPSGGGRPPLKAAARKAANGLRPRPLTGVRWGGSPRTRRSLPPGRVWPGR